MIETDAYQFALLFLVKDHTIDISTHHNKYDFTDI